MNDAKIKPSAYRILFFGFFIISCQKCMKTYQYIVALMATPEATHNDSWIAEKKVAVITNPAPKIFLITV